jgi:hypothetical protein
VLEFVDLSKIEEYKTELLQDVPSTLKMMKDALMEALK